MTPTRELSADIDSVDVALTASMPPKRRVTPKRVAAVVLGLAMVAGIVVAILVSSRSSKIMVPEKFSATYVVTDSNAATPNMYGKLVKTPGTGGSNDWEVSGYVETVKDGVTTRYTYTNDRGYYQEIDDMTGAVQVAGCLSAASVPPMQGLGFSLNDASPVDPDHMAASVTTSCDSSTAMAFQFFGQTYVYCTPGGEHAFVGSSFTAKVATVDTTSATHLSTPTGTDNQPMDCPVLNVAETSASVATKRLLKASADDHTWHLDQTVVHRVLFDDDDQDGCCGCRRRLWFEELSIPHEDRRLQWVAQTPLSTQGGKLESFPGVTIPSQTQGPNKFGTGSAPTICKCCTLPGIENTDGTYSPPPECMDTTVVELNTAVPWNSDEQLNRLCDQIAGGHTGQTIPSYMHIFGMSTGNLALALAVQKGKCVFAEYGDNFWTMIEGALIFEDDLAAYCKTFSKDGFYWGLPNMCEYDSATGGFIPTTAALAMAPGAPDVEDAYDVIKYSVDSVVAFERFGAGELPTPPIGYDSARRLDSQTRYFALSTTDTDSMATNLIDTNRVVAVSTLASPSGQDGESYWGPQSFTASGFGSSPLFGRTLGGGGGGGGDIMVAPRTLDGGVSTVSNFYTYLGDSTVTM